MFNPCDCSSSLKGAPFKVLKLFPPKVLGARDFFFVDQNDGESNFQKNAVGFVKMF